MTVPRDIKKVLLFTHMGIGNIIMFLPAIRTFRKYFPDASFTLVTYRKNITNFSSILNGLIDNYIPFNGSHAGIIERRRFIGLINKTSPDVLIKNFLGNYNLLIDRLNVPYRVGHISSGGFEIKGDGVFNCPAMMKKDNHEIDRNLELCHASGIKNLCRNFHISVCEETRKWAEDFFNSHNLNEPVICMQIGTSMGSGWKEWGGFGEVARLIGKGARFILLGDYYAMDKAKNVERISPSIVNLVGRTNLMEAMAILERSNLLLSNDGGLVWVAQAVGTPVVVIYGPTDYTRTRPLGPNDKIIRKDLPCSPCYRTPKDYYKPRRCKNRKCLSLITPEEVAEEVYSSSLSASLL